MIHFAEHKTNSFIILGAMQITRDSVFQPGFRGTQRFRQFLTGFPENPQISTILSI
jgi:hypothetical protein